MSFALSPRPSKRRRIETEKQIEMVSKITKNMVGSKNAILQAKLKNLQLKKNKLDILCYAKEPKQHTLSEFDVLIAANEVEVELEILRSSKRFKRMEDRYLRRFCQAKHSRDDSTTPEKISRSINTPTNITLSQDKENIPRNLTTRSMCDKSVNTDPVHIEEIIPDNRSTGLCSTEHNVLMFSDLEKSLSPVRRQIPLSDNKRLQIERLQTNKENFVSSDQIEPNWFESSFEIDLLNEKPKRSQNILYSDISSSSISKYSSSNEKYQDFTQIDGSNLINTHTFAIDLSNYLKDKTVTLSKKKSTLLENNERLSKINEKPSEKNMTLSENNVTLSEDNETLSKNIVTTSKSVKNKDTLKIPETLTPISISRVRIPRTIIKSSSTQNLSSLENINSQNTTKAIVSDTAVPKNNMFPKHTKKFAKPGVEFEKAMETKPNQKDEQIGNSPLSMYSLEMEREVLLTKLQELCVKYQNLACKSENLTTNSQGLSTKCLNLQNSKEILLTGSKELATKSQNIFSKSKDLSNKSNELTTKSKEYSIKCEKLSTKYRDLLARSKEISTKAQHISKDLSAKPQDTCIANSKLSMKSKEFSTKLQELSAKSIQMSTKYKELSVQAKETTINHKELE